MKCYPNGLLWSRGAADQEYHEEDGDDQADRVFIEIAAAEAERYDQ